MRRTEHHTVASIREPTHQTVGNFQGRQLTESRAFAAPDSCIGGTRFEHSLHEIRQLGPSPHPVLPALDPRELPDSWP